MYARIRLVDTGVRPPSETSVETKPTPFNIILEPLYLGVLPASMLPVLLFLAPVLLFASCFVVPRIHGYLRKVANDVRAEFGEQSIRKEE